RILLFISSLILSWGLLWTAALNFQSIETHFISERSEHGAVKKKTAELMALSKSDTLDFLFLGSSTCYRGIDPHYLDPLKGFGVCSSTQRIGNSSYILDVALEYTSTHYLVIDVYPKLWSDAGVVNKEAAIDWVVNSSTPRSGPIKEMVLATGVPYYIAVAGYFWLADFIGVDYPSYKKRTQDHYKGLGFVTKDVKPIESVVCDDIDVEMSDETCEILRGIISKSSVHGAPTILLNPPQLCEESFSTPACFSDVIYIDGNDWPGAKTPAYYYDDHHLVDQGAASYSAWLSEELKTITSAFEASND
ncbi:MAG: hypothetical protein P8L64_01490, partial [Flavobacteriales bacterium]|nr:hypothetical protein [Flavobacteriales bacterium]